MRSHVILHARGIYGTAINRKLFRTVILLDFSVALASSIVMCCILGLQTRECVQSEATPPTSSHITKDTL